MDEFQEPINYYNYNFLNNNAQVNKNTEELEKKVSRMEIDSPTEVGNNNQNPKGSTNYYSGKNQNYMNQQNNSLSKYIVNNINENTNQKNNNFKTYSSISSITDIESINNYSQNKEDKISCNKLNLDTNGKERTKKK